MKSTPMSGVKKNNHPVFRSFIQFVFLLLITACNQPAHHQQQGSHTASTSADTSSYLRKADSIGRLLQPGDLVFRRGNDFASLTFANMNREDRRFSHVGIIQIINGTPMVYHALGGSFNPNQKILLEPLSRFIAPYENRSFGIYRLTTPAPKLLLTRILDSIYKAEVPFDLNFDLETDNRLYCSEFVYKVFKRSDPPVKFSLSDAGGRKYVSTETFTLSTYTKQLFFCELK